MGRCYLDGCWATRWWEVSDPTDHWIKWRQHQGLGCGQILTGCEFHDLVAIHADWRFGVSLALDTRSTLTKTSGSVLDPVGWPLSSFV